MDFGLKFEKFFRQHNKNQITPRSFAYLSPWAFVCPLRVLKIYVIAFPIPPKLFSNKHKQTHVLIQNFRIAVQNWRSGQNTRKLFSCAFCLRCVFTARKYTAKIEWKLAVVNIVISTEIQHTTSASESAVIKAEQRRELMYRESTTIGGAFNWSFICICTKQNYSRG